jgi:surface polysaccharide O-acyltransferase-like enzyme
MNGRLLEVDLIKGVGIVVVVLIHSLRSFFDPGATAFESWLNEQLRFAVPGFLVASGFLYASREPIPWAVTVRRLRRIALPYLVASLGAQLYQAQTGASLGTTGSLAQDLLFGASFGPYYYVFHALLLVLLAPLLVYVPARAFALALVALLAVQLWLDVSRPLVSWFFMLRNPLRWWPYFLVGWWLRLYGPALRAALAERRAGALAATGLAVLGLGALPALDVAPAAARLATWLQIWASLGVLLALGAGRTTRPGALAYLSDASYAIYLFHLFALFAVRAHWPPAPDALDAAALGAAFAAGLGSALALVAAGRAALGPRARDWLGA